MDLPAMEIRYWFIVLSLVPRSTNDRLHRLQRKATHSVALTYKSGELRSFVYSVRSTAHYNRIKYLWTRIESNPAKLQCPRVFLGVMRANAN